MPDRLDMFEQMIKKGSTDPFVWYARAMELRSRKRLEDALEAYAEVERRFPDYVPTYLMAGQVAEQLGRTEDAHGFYQRGIEKARAAADGHALSELEAALDGLA